jgi:acyl dehydratase
MSDGYTFHVDRTAIMLFASAIGETNKIYYDEEYARSTPLGGVIAPPSFPTASSQWDGGYFLRGVRQIPEPPPRAEPTEGEKAQRSKRGTGGGLARGLHAEQHYTYHRPVEPGMKLTVTTERGKTWQKEGRRGGTLHFSETVTEFRDEQGELVVTATSIGVQTSKAVEGDS